MLAQMLVWLECGVGKTSPKYACRLPEHIKSENTRQQHSQADDNENRNRLPAQFSTWKVLPRNRYLLDQSQVV
jgi:hypothetical protein